MSNLAAVLHGPGDLRIQDVERPTPGPGQVLVRVSAVGICGSDVHYYDHGRIGPFVVDHPMVLGHESAGRIIAVGPGVDRNRVDERVALEPGVPCGHCTQCRTGHYNLCPDVAFFATPPVDGSIAEYVCLDSEFAFGVPDHVTDVQAAMAEPVSVGIWAARKAGIGVGQRVLVTGAGPVGLFAAQVAKAHGAHTVVVTDLVPQRLAVARSLGLSAVPATEPLQERFDVLLECSGSARALDAALPLVDRSGRVVLVGMGADTVSLPVPLIQNREIWVTGTFRYANTYPTAIELISTGAVQVDPVVTHHFSLQDTESALLAARRDPGALKAVVHITHDPAVDDAEIAVVPVS